MDRRTLLFIAISIFIIVGYQEFVLKPLTPPPPEPTVAAPDTAVGRSGQPATADGTPPSAGIEPEAVEDAPFVADAAPAAGTAKPSGRDITVDTDLFRAVFNTAGGRLHEFHLKDYTATNEPDSELLSLMALGPEVERPFGIELRGAQVWSDSRSTYTADASSLELTGSQTGTLTFRTELSGLPIVKRFVFQGDRYPFQLEVETPEGSALPAALSSEGPRGELPSLALVQSRTVPAESDWTNPEGAANLIEDELVLANRADIEDTDVHRGAIGWAGFQTRYFLTAAAPDRAESVRLRTRGTAIETKVITPRAASGPTSVSYTLYFGPKDLDELEAAGHDFRRGVDLGWFGPIALVLLQVMNFFHKFTSNYGVDIILLTVLVKVAFWPLNQKQMQSMRAMQKLQPEMTKLKEKHAEDPNQMNQEMMELYKRHGVNPLGGCLPMVVQIPVFFGLYQALLNTIQLRHAPFFGWVTDLAAPERLMILGYGIPVLTLLLGASMFLQQKMSPPAGDPTQQKIMMFMPVMFTFMFIGFPAGLTLYWLTNNVLTIGQQYMNLRTADA